MQDGAPLLHPTIPSRERGSMTKEKQIIEGWGGARPYILIGVGAVIGGTGPHWGIPPYGGTHDYTERGI